MTEHATDAVAFVDPPTADPRPPQPAAPEVAPDPAEMFLLAYGSWRSRTDPIASAQALLRLDAAYQAAFAASRFHYAP